jgi:hypothetical protein
MSGVALREAAAKLSPAPCDLGCPMRQRCISELLACRAFNAYLRRERFSRITTKREPSRAWHDKIFPGDKGEDF